MLNYNLVDNARQPINQRYATRVITSFSCHFEKPKNFMPLPIDKLMIVYKDTASNLELNKGLFKILIASNELSLMHKEVLMSFVKRYTPFHHFTTTPCVQRSKPSVTFGDVYSLFACGNAIDYTEQQMTDLLQTDYYNGCRLSYNAVTDALARLGPMPQAPILRLMVQPPAILALNAISKANAGNAANFVNANPENDSSDSGDEDFEGSESTEEDATYEDDATENIDHANDQDDDEEVDKDESDQDDAEGE